MRRTNKILSQRILELYSSTSSIDIDNFFNAIGRTKEVVWVEFNREILFLSSNLAICLNKHRTDYAANYEGKERGFTLRGKSIHFKGEDYQQVSEHIKVSFKSASKVTTRSWFLDWVRAYDYVCRSSEGIVKSQTVEIDSLTPDTGVILKSNSLYIDTQLIARVLNIEHQSVLVLISRYKEDLESYGSLDLRETISVNSVKAQATSKYYLLNEDQAYFLGTLSRNTKTAVQFKKWIVQQFSNARKIISIKNQQDNSESLLHSQLMELSLYTSLKVSSEYPLTYFNPGKGIETTKRIDLLINNQIAIELKNVRITSAIINEIINTRGYYHTLKKLPNFKYLILSSPLGCSVDAERLLEVLHPKIIFAYPEAIGDKFGALILKEYPKDSHWWVINFLFPRFPNVLSEEFLRIVTNHTTNSESKALASCDKL